MGNTVGIEVPPIPMEDLIKRNHSQVEEHSLNCYNSIIRAWVFKSYKEDDLDVVSQNPLHLEKFTGFNEECCYIVLHSYNKNRIECLADDKTDKTESNLIKGLEIIKTTKNLTPRGQTNCFGGFHSVSGVLNNCSSQSSDSKYDIYIWNGKNASSWTKANSLAKFFDLDGALKDFKNLDYLTQSSSNLISISSIFSFDKESMESEEWNLLIKSNHLLSALNGSNQIVEIVKTRSKTITSKKKGQTKRRKSKRSKRNGKILNFH